MCQVYNRAIFLYTNRYLRETTPRCEDFPRILGLRPYSLHDRFGGRALRGTVIPTKPRLLRIGVRDLLFDD